MAITLTHVGIDLPEWATPCDGLCNSDPVACLYYYDEMAGVAAYNALTCVTAGMGLPIEVLQLQRRITAAALYTACAHGLCDHADPSECLDWHGEKHTSHAIAAGQFPLPGLPL